MIGEMGDYYAYHTGSIALRLICRKAVISELKGVKAPRGKKKTVEAMILGRRYKVLVCPPNVDEILDNLAEYQAKNAVKDLPLRDPSQCTWEQLWQGYKERYRK